MWLKKTYFWRYDEIVDMAKLNYFSVCVCGGGGVVRFV